MEKYDIFVGNLPFNITEEQLQKHFSIFGNVKKVRMLNDKDTGRPKGFAFVEYHEALTALNAIKKLNKTELEGKELRVGFAANSTLKEKAKELGFELDDDSEGSATQAVVNTMSLPEAWDILNSMKQLVNEDEMTARNLLETYPQLVFALHEIQRRLGIVWTATAAPTTSDPNTMDMPFTISVPAVSQVVSQGMYIPPPPIPPSKYSYGLAQGAQANSMQPMMSVPSYQTHDSYDTGMQSQSQPPMITVPALIPQDNYDPVAMQMDPNGIYYQQHTQYQEQDNYGQNAQPYDDSYYQSTANPSQYNQQQPMYQDQQQYWN